MPGMLRYGYLCFVGSMLVASAGAFAQNTPTIAINVVGKSTVANTAPYGTVVDAFQARTASGTLVPLITWSVDNPDFYTDPLGDLHTNWNSIIMPGTQAMMITASGTGVRDRDRVPDGHSDRHPSSTAEHFDHAVKYRVFAYLDRDLIDFLAEHFDHVVNRVYYTNLGRKLDHRDECERRRDQQLSVSVWPAVCRRRDR
jgi:hypothetical protein